MLSNTLISIDDPQIRKFQLCELPYLNISSPITNMPHLTNADIDLNMPIDQNFNYYTLNEFNTYRFLHGLDS